MELVLFIDRCNDTLKASIESMHVKSEVGWMSKYKVVAYFKVSLQNLLGGRSRSTCVNIASVQVDIPNRDLVYIKHSF